MKKIILLLSLFLFGCYVANAQTITGKLVDQNGNGLSNLQLQLYISPKVYNATSSSDGSFTFSNITNVKDQQLPIGYAVSENFPNPFNPKTRIGITLPNNGSVRVGLYNLLGQKVRDEIERYFSAGTNYIDIELNGLSNGFYLARMTLDEKYVVTKKLMLMYGSQHLNSASGLSNFQLNKSSLGGNSVLETIIDSLVATSSIIIRKVFSNLPSMVGNSLNLGILTIDRFCSGLPTVLYSGKTYNTVQIGNQCWLRENLDVGTRIDGSAKQTNNGTIEKYCYNDNPTNCNTYGGLYQWAEAVQYKNGATNNSSANPSLIGNIQGICPNSWHIPSQLEFNSLMVAVHNNSNALKNIGQGSISGAGTNESGFAVLLAGNRDSFGPIFGYLGNSTMFWSLTESSSDNSRAVKMWLQDMNNTISIAPDGLKWAVGMSIRCVKDEEIPPTVPTLNSPANGSANQTLLPILSWNASATAKTYTLQVSTNNSFINFVYNQSGLTNTSQQINSLANSTVYFWRVNATGDYGTSPYSTVWSFTTGISPSTPTLASPTDGATGISLSTTMYWNLSSGATSYTLQVSTSNAFTSFVYNQSNITNTNQLITGLSYFTKYYWRVSAVNNSLSSGWSTVWSFNTIGTTPQTPTLLSPSNGATEISTSPTLSWNQSLYASTYTLQVSINNTFNTFVYNQSGITIASQQITGLSNSVSYYWRVQAVNSNGVSTWSNVNSFNTIITVPLAPTLSSPQNAAVGVTLNPTFFWNLSSAATSYTLQVSSMSDFSSFAYNQSGLINTNQQVTGLTVYTKYYWRVGATNNYGNSTWSDSWLFYTKNIPCPDVSTVTYQGKIYNTVQIGTQCWLKENVDVGTIINGSQNQTNNGVIEKYCYDDGPNNCSIYGGLYQWAEAVQYNNGATNTTSPNPAFTGNVQGLCPSGWHIPSKSELQILAATVNNDGNSLKEVGQGVGSAAGTNTSGFSALLAGVRNKDGGFGGSYGLGGLGAYIGFWSSDEFDGFTAHSLYLTNSDSYLNWGAGYKTTGISVRCIKN